MQIRNERSRLYHSFADTVVALAMALPRRSLDTPLRLGYGGDTLNVQATMESHWGTGQSLTAPEREMGR
jgi:hypothetical protein